MILLKIKKNQEKILFFSVVIFRLKNSENDKYYEKVQSTKCWPLS